MDEWVRDGVAESGERARNDGSRILSAVGRTRRRGEELETETVIWRPSRNGDVLCHFSPRDSNGCPKLTRDTVAYVTLLSGIEQSC